MKSVVSRTRLFRKMLQTLRLTAPDAPPGPALDGLLAGMLDVFVHGGGCVRAAVVLLESGDEFPRVRAAAPVDGGTWLRGEGLFALLRPGPPDFVPLPGSDTKDQAIWFGRSSAGGDDAVAPLAVAVLRIDDPGGREVRGALVAELDPSGGVARSMIDAAALVDRAVAMHVGLTAERGAHAAETVALRGRVSTGFAEVFGLRGCPGLGGLRTGVERAARESGPVLVWGEAGTGKAKLARLIHEVSPRAVRPFLAASLSDAAEVFGVAGGGFPRPGAMEDAAGGSVYLADVADMASGRDDPDIPGRLARLVTDGRFSRIGSTTSRQTSARLILGSTLSPEKLAREVPGLEPLFGPGGGRDGQLLVLRLPALRERPGDISVLTQRAVALLAGRSGTRPRFSPRAVKALVAYPWPGNDAEVETLVAEALLSRSGERIDVGDLPPRVFSLIPGNGMAVAGNGAKAPPDAGGRQAAAGPPYTLWDMERARMLEALARHEWVKARAARELGLTPRQLGWRMKRHGLSRTAGG